MNLLIGAVCIVALTLWLAVVPEGSNLWRNVATFLYMGVGLNMILAPFNLLPIPPLDGSHILAGFSPYFRNLYQRPHAQMIGLFVFIAVFFMTPMGGILFSFGWRVAQGLIDLAGGLVGNPSIGRVLY